MATNTNMATTYVTRTAPVAAVPLSGDELARREWATEPVEQGRNKRSI